MVQSIKLLTLFITVFFSSYSLATSLSKNDDNVITWAGCGITKKAFMAELAIHYENKTGVKVLLSGGGATKGLRDAASLKIDIGGSCRMNLPGINKAEILANLHPVAWDALSVIVHKSNPVNNLTTQQIKDIYIGKINNWKQLGGPDQPIELYVRRGKLSGVGYTIRQYVFKDSDVEFVQKHVVNSSGPLEKAVETDKWALGITGIRDNGTVPYKEALNLMSKLLIYGFGVN